jgi:hypothetical protein
MAYFFGMDDTNAKSTAVGLDDPADEAISEQEEQAEREWDEQIARDIRAGRLDALINQAKADYAAGLCNEVTQNGLFSSS